MIQRTHPFVELILHILEADGKLILKCLTFTREPFANNSLRQINERTPKGSCDYR